LPGKSNGLLNTGQPQTLVETPSYMDIELSEEVMPSQHDQRGNEVMPKLGQELISNPVHDSVGNGSIAKLGHEAISGPE